jgi:hypothetical protein
MMGIALACSSGVGVAGMAVAVIVAVGSGDCVGVRVAGATWNGVGVMVGMGVGSNGRKGMHPAVKNIIPKINCLMNNFFVIQIPQNYRLYIPILLFNG